VPGPSVHWFSPHTSRGESDFQNLQPVICLPVDFINGPLLVSFFSITLKHLTMEEKAHDDHSDPQRA
jgi:hypothetical protein